jgi:predicted transcriptional regulator
MILDTAEANCILSILRILNKGQSKYSTMFKETKASHTTLQTVLKELITKKFVVKKDIGHMNVDYEISAKGKKLLQMLEELKALI